ncbi:hypothetical protein K503DRAFT_515731 [Rhizopogon vinicolor AM-OR11-026]|uniref:Uncharacterized protein n=1 Tax=Rhizopogon vinicolor AM-OR11-026 TaxID=1314800 RepID=A0A1B7MLU3_9AGAM|nr:hypothetical protein K503DRAFT_515731 [Rhizopogon vinicolor AM-OR11-026]
MVNPKKGEKVKQELRVPKEPKRSGKSRMMISDTEELMLRGQEQPLTWQGSRLKVRSDSRERDGRQRSRE